jgi:hypothetical protein
MKTRIIIAVLVTCAFMLGCVGYFPAKTQRQRDVEQCTYGVVVPDNIRRRDRAAYIQHESVPACLRAKGYRDVEPEA